MTESHEDASAKGRHGWRQTIGSIMAAGLGVQSNANRERDFAHGSAKRFIIGGLVGTAIFILVIYAVVHIVLSAAGA